MTLEKLIKCCDHLTPTENLLAQYILQNKDQIQHLSVQELANNMFVSKSAIHRFCKKIGVGGFNELKIKLSHDSLDEREGHLDIDVNFPFEEHDSENMIAQRLLKLYEASILDTYQSIDSQQLKQSVKLLHEAQMIDIYTCAHNLNVAENFQDKMLSIGRVVHCPKSHYEQRCLAIASNENHVALILSYSGKATFVQPIVDILTKRQVKLIFIGGLKNDIQSQQFEQCLYISDRENFKNRISQFSSHIGMQYMLDIIFSCIFKMDYKKNIDHTRHLAILADDREIDED